MGENHNHTTTYLTVDQVALRYGVCQRLIYDALKNGRLSGIRIGGCWRVSEEALKSYERSGGDRPSDKAINKPIQSSGGTRRRRRRIVIEKINI